MTPDTQVISKPPKRRQELNRRQIQTDGLVRCLGSESEVGALCIGTYSV
jgi:hypothetical protein